LLFRVAHPCAQRKGGLHIYRIELNWCCPSVNALLPSIDMRNSKQKAALDKAVAKAAQIIEAHLGTLTRAKSRAMLRDIHTLAVKAAARQRA
jgi:hypothetical protein